MEKLVAQLPDALDLMARGLKVGHPLNVTVASVATEMSDPIGSEFGLLVDQVSFGTEIADAFADLADRTDLEDTRSLAVSVGIQHGTGGNLARVLNVLAKVIRDRATMRRKITAISAEGRLSAFILSVLPFGIFGSI
jgi:tight adherence protein B